MVRAKDMTARELVGLGEGREEGTLVSKSVVSLEVRAMLCLNWECVLCTEPGSDRALPGSYFGDDMLRW